MKKNIFIIILLLFSSILFSQNKAIVDSLKNELKLAKEDTNKVNILNNLSFSLYLDGTKEGIRYGNAALKLATKLKWNKGIGDAHNSLGVCARTEANYSEALTHFYKALKINEDLEDKTGLAVTLNGLGLISHDLDDFPRALNYFFKALEINTKLGDEKTMARNLNNIASCYTRQKKHRKGLDYFKKSLYFSEKNKDTLYIGFGLTNIGITYNELKEYPKAIEYINKSIKLYNDDSRLFNGYNKFELGRSYYLMALELPKTEEREDLFKKSLPLFEMANKSFEKYNSLNDLQESYRYTSNVHQELGHSKMALSYFEKSSKLKDSIFSTKTKDKIENIESQRKIDLRDKQIQIQELQIKSKARTVYLLISLSLAIGLLLTVFFWLFISKRKTNKLLEEKNKEISNINSQKDRFFSIIAHDLRGPFNVFLGLTEFLAEDIENMTQEEIQYSAVSMRDSASNLFRLLENLLEWSRMKQGMIPFQPETLYLLPLVKETISVLQESAKKKEIEISNDIQEGTTIFADKNMLLAIIRNIISNAIKFTPKGGKINITAIIDKEKNVEIRVSDSGIGMTPKIIDHLFDLDVKTSRSGTEDEPSTGLGLILCKDFIEKHNGKIWAESNEGKGSTFHLTFPNKKV